MRTFNIGTTVRIDTFYKIHTERMPLAPRVHCWYQGAYSATRPTMATQTKFLTSFVQVYSQSDSEIVFEWATALSMRIELELIFGKYFICRKYYRLKLKYTYAVYYYVSTLLSNDNIYDKGSTNVIFDRKTTDSSNDFLQ